MPETMEEALNIGKKQKQFNSKKKKGVDNEAFKWSSEPNRSSDT